jgi:beta-glucosidase
VVTVFVSGRPVYANDLLNLSHAFVAAWLPGTEGKGVADVLFADARGRAQYDFGGRLSFPWPGTPCGSSFSAAAMAAEPPLFPGGYGLKYGSRRTQRQVAVSQLSSCDGTRP